jgi:hypothetical protein
MYFGEIFLAKMLTTAIYYLLALATSSDATKNINDPISIAPPKVAKASSHVSLALSH